MDFTRIARFCFRPLRSRRRVCLTFSGRGDVAYLRRVVRKLRRLGLLRLLLVAILTGDVLGIRRILALVSRFPVRIRFTSGRTVRIFFCRNGVEFAVLRVGVTFVRSSNRSC
ncbi:hypothetical protein RAC89_03685 [Paenibacillus sp. GD4]|uniref:hypothetical protein n=1 Tax=Paenibacillus sp. GD4 TaxID=3068890 RepID=UPI0027968BD0|nr:hypothetical protein [Paenibacillus sp. GD4]MDQ1909606.1 hypothetical protein [Paenibacillus sp. GD4]